MKNICPISTVTPKELGAKITFKEKRGKGNRTYQHIRIELENNDEYEVNFGPDATDEEILNLPIRNWRII